MTKTVGILTRDPDFYLLASHILAKDGYRPILIEPEQLNDSNILASAVIVDCSDVLAMTKRCVLLRRVLGKTIPILAFLSARDEPHYLSVIKAGVTECIVRPASPEFVLRALASNLSSPGIASATRRIINLPEGELRLDTRSREVSMGARNIKLSPTEFRLLEKLLHLPGRVMSRKELAEAWPRGRYVSDHTLDVHMSKLRQALRSISDDTLIRTVRHGGFAVSTPSST